MRWQYWKKEEQIEANAQKPIISILFLIKNIDLINSKYIQNKKIK